MRKTAFGAGQVDPSTQGVRGSSGSSLEKELAGLRVDEQQSHAGWASKPFLDILREHVLPKLQEPVRFSAFDGSAETAAGQAEARRASEEGGHARVMREARAALASVCVDWAAAHCQAAHDAAQVRLWDEQQVASLAAFLRARPRVAALRLCCPPLDLTDTPGMVAAVGELLYGSGAAAAPPGGGGGSAAAGKIGGMEAGGEAGGSAAGGHRSSTARDSNGAGPSGSGADVVSGAAAPVIPGPHGGGVESAAGGEHGGVQGATRGDVGGTLAGGSGGCSSTAPRTYAAEAHQHCGCSALPASLRALEAEGVTAVPLLLLAACSLPVLERLALSQLPAAFTYREGLLPWPAGAEERLGALLPQELLAAAEDPELHTLVYGAAVHRRFRSYWSSFARCLAALLAARGAGLAELSLEAPARSVGLRALSILAAQRPARLTSLRLHRFGLRREPHAPPRVPLERAGLALEQGLRELAALAAAAAGPAAAAGAAAGPPGVAGLERTPTKGQAELALRAAGELLHPHSAAVGSVAPALARLPPPPPAPPPPQVPCCGLTRLELLSCGAEPLGAEVLEGLTCLQSLSLRDSVLVWLDRPPDLRRLAGLTRLDLRRSEWLGPEGAPWEATLELPAGLRGLDLVGFSSLTSVDLSPLSRLTALAEMSDITLTPDPEDTAARHRHHGSRRRRRQPLPLPYAQLAALTCMNSLEDYVRRPPPPPAAAAARNSGGGGGAGSSGGGRGIGVRSGSETEPGSESGSESESESESGSSQGSSGYGRSGGYREGVSGSGSGGAGGNGGGMLASHALSPASTAALERSCVFAPPLTSLTLHGVLPQDVSHLFPLLPLLTRLVFAGKAEGGYASDEEREDDDAGRLVLRAGELPSLCELELVVGLLGWGQLALGPATRLTRLVVDDVEFVDVRYVELPSSLRHLSLTAWFGLPELYALNEGPGPVATSLDGGGGGAGDGAAALAAAMAAATRDRMNRRAAAAMAAEAAEAATGGGDYSDVRISSDGSEDGGSSVGGSGDEGQGSSVDWDSGLDLQLLQAQCGDLGRSLEAEVERLLLRRLLPPLTQLRLLQLSWDVVTRGPPGGQPGAGGARGGGGGGAAEGGEVGGGGGEGGRWPFPRLPCLEELDVAWMRELPESDLSRLLAACPALRAVTHCNGSRRCVRTADGSWLRRQAGRAGLGAEET